MGFSGFRVFLTGDESQSASSRLIRLIVPGKPLPFKPEEWPRVVEDS
ncbi:MAG: hypothetical protein ACO2OR_03755 [Desulfurococcaceae archaeon]